MKPIVYHDRIIVCLVEINFIFEGQCMFVAEAVFKEVAELYYVLVCFIFSCVTLADTINMASILRNN